MTLKDILSITLLVLQLITVLLGWRVREKVAKDWHPMLMFFGISFLIGLSGSLLTSGEGIHGIKSELLQSLAAGSGRELEIGVNALYGIPPVAIMFGRYSATSRQVVMQAYVTNVGTDFINGNYARLTYNPSGTPVLTNISTAVSAYGTGASNLTGQAVKTVTATTY